MFHLFVLFCFLILVPDHKHSVCCHPWLMHSVCERMIHGWVTAACDSAFFFSAHFRLKLQLFLSVEGPSMQLKATGKRWRHTNHYINKNWTCIVRVDWLGMMYCARPAGNFGTVVKAQSYSYKLCCVCIWLRCCNWVQTGKVNKKNSLSMSAHFLTSFCEIDGLATSLLSSVVLF